MYHFVVVGGGGVAHLCQDRIPIWYLCRSYWWWHTRACHPHGPRQCKSRTSSPGTGRGSDRARPANYPRSQPCLVEQRHSIVSKTKTKTIRGKCQKPDGGLPLTASRAESIFLVLIKVGRGGAPAVAVAAALRGAAVVRLAEKYEGKYARALVAVAVERVQNCQQE